MARGDLADRHLAELHALAAGAGVPKYRLLRRDELIERLDEAGVEPPEEPQEAERPPQRDDAEETGGRGRRRRRGGRGGRGRDDRSDRDRGDRDGDDGREEAADGPTEEVSGVLDILPQRYGFLRLSGL